mmetsp:Transcript_32824/g.73085  ORF Transcript_32824/g.73085 Transcript_32824/m.73085 type:complete len:507 (+) Transcript_32824:91-1611(+)
MKSLYQLFTENIPLQEEIRKFPQHYLVPFGVVAYAILLSLYALFFWLAYEASSKESFISLDSGSGVCTEIERPLTGVYLGSSNGAWEGDSDFKYTQAKYEFRFSGLLTRSDQFASLVGEDFSTEEVGAYMRNHDIADNLLAYMHYQKFVQVGGKTQSFSLFSSPSDIFSTRYMDGFLIGDRSYCPLQSVLFDTSSAVLLLSVDGDAGTTTLEDDDAPGVCARLLGNIVQEKDDGTTLGVELNMNSLSLAAAVNSGVLGVDTLEVLETFDHTEDEYVFAISAVYDSRYENADVIYCFSTATNATSHLPLSLSWLPHCMAVTGKSLVLPLFTHSDPGCIGCDGPGPSDDDDDDDDGQDGCSEPRILAMVLFAPQDGIGLEQLVRLLVQLNGDALRRSAANMTVNFSFGDFELLAHCPSCSLLAVEFIESVVTVSPYQLPIHNGHCADSVSSPDFARLRSPPSPLIEIYYECTPTPLSSFYVAISVAFGNCTAPLTPIVILNPPLYTIY